MDKTLRQIVRARVDREGGKVRAIALTIESTQFGDPFEPGRTNSLRALSSSTAMMTLDEARQLARWLETHANEAEADGD